MISPTRFFEMYVAMGLHFKEGSKYNYIKYGGKTRVSTDSLNRRNDKYFFEKFAAKVANEDEATQLLLANFIDGNDYITKLSFDSLNSFHSYRDALAYRYEQDLERWTILNAINECYAGSIEPYYFLIVTNESYKQSGHTFALLDAKFGEHDILWSDLKEKLNKIAPFVVQYFNIDKEQICSIMSNQVAA